MKQAQVMLYPNKIVVSTWNKVTDGFWIVTDNVTLLPAECPNGLLGETVFKHVNDSKENVARPTSLQENLKQFLKAIKLRSNVEYEKGAHVGIDKKRDTIKLIPTIYGGTKGDNKGFRDRADKKIELEEFTPEIIGKKVREAWKNCL